MTHVATRRLLEASATLDAADRALLNIWVNRDLDDRQLARMTGLNDAALAARRVRIVTHLSATLGLPPETVRGALDDIAASATRASIATGATAPARDTAGVDLTAHPAPGAAPDADGAASAVQDPAGDSRTRRRLWRWGLPLTAIAAVVLIVSLSAGGSGHSRHQTTAAAGVAVPASAVSPVTAPSPLPSSRPAATSTRSPGDPLVVLAGGPAHATGIVQVTGKRPNLRLDLSVSQLPAVSPGHYEVWLYDSIIYARDLGRLPPGVSHVTLRLPPNARRFRWIDISFQPPGAVFHSGESRLRARDPLFRKG